MPTVYSGAGEDKPVTLLVPFPDDNVTGAAIDVCLGYSLPSGAWQTLTTPDSATIASDGHSVSVTLTIGSGGAINPIGGTYLLWTRAKGAPNAGDVILGVCRTTAIKVTTDTGTPVVTYPAFVATVNGSGPDAQGNVNVAGGGGSGGVTVTDTDNGDGTGTLTLVTTSGGTTVTDVDNGDGTGTLAIAS